MKLPETLALLATVAMCCVASTGPGEVALMAAAAMLGLKISAASFAGEPARARVAVRPRRLAKSRISESDSKHV